MPVGGEYKTNVGLRDVYYALVTQDDTSAYAAGTPALLAPAMTVSIAPAVNAKTIYADDAPFDVFTSEGETKLDFELTQIPMEIRAIILGKVFDAATGRLFDNGGTPPDIALSFRSKKSNGKYHYVQYLKGKFTSPSRELASETDTPDPKSTKITFTAVKTTKQFVLSGSVTDGAKGVEGDTDITGFSAASWFTAVQVPVQGSPSALTMTPVPADNATSVSVSADQTLTFSNPMDANVLLGISMIKASDDSPVACTITINAARTIVTINPNSNLTATTEHYINVFGVKDIYGQTLAHTVVSFTTA